MRNLLIVCLLALLTACGSGGERPPDPTQAEVWAQVDATALDLMERAGPAHVLLVGDSLTFHSPLTHLCGVPVIRAGYPAGTWQDVAARPIWSHMRSWVVVVQLGTNNVAHQVPVSSEAMMEFMNRVQGRHVLVETIPPMFMPELWTPDRDLRVAAMQADVLALGYPFIDSRVPMNNPALYSDGEHWNGSGYAVQHALLESNVCSLIEQERASS